MSGKYRKLGKNTLVLTIGNISSKILSYLLVPLYTYTLTTSDYGVVDLISTTVTLLIPILSLSISEAIIRFTLDKETDKSAVLSIGVFLSVTSSLLIIALRPLFRLSSIIDGHFYLFWGLYISRALSDVFGQFAKGCERVKTYTIAAVIQTGSFLICNILFLLVWRWGITGFLLANIISNILNTTVIILFAHVAKYVRLLRKEDIESIKRMISYSIPMIPNNISWWISNFSDRYILLFFHGTALVGLYSTAYKIPSILQVFTIIFWSAWQISAVEDFGTKSSIDFFGSVYRALSSVMAIVCAAIIMGSEIIATVAFKKEFFASWRFSPLLIFGFLFSGMSSFLGTVYTSAKKTKSIFVSTIIGAMLNIILNFLLIPSFNGYGAAFATMLSYFAIWIFRVFDSRKIIKLDIDLRKDVINYVVISIMIVVMNLVSDTLKYPLLICGLIVICINENRFLRKLGSFKKKI